MKFYTSNGLQSQERVVFTAEETFTIHRVLSNINNQHPAFLAARTRFNDDTANISKAQYNVIDNSLKYNGFSDVATLVQTSPFSKSVKFKGNLNQVFQRFASAGISETKQYDDFRYLASSPYIMKVTTDAGTFYFGFGNPIEMRDAGEILEETMFW